MAPYERLVAWEPRYQLVLKVYRATQGFPKSALYGLTSQLPSQCARTLPKDVPNAAAES